jgi:hypothetical protein
MHVNVGQDSQGPEVRKTKGGKVKKRSRNGKRMRWKKISGRMRNKGGECE